MADSGVAAWSFQPTSFLPHIPLEAKAPFPSMFPETVPQRPCEKTKAKKKRRKKKKSLERLQRVMAEEYTAKKALLEEMEQREKERYGDRRLEREKERVLRHFQIHEKPHVPCNHKKLEKEIKEKEKTKEKELRDQLRDKKIEQDLLSSKNPVWKASMKGHSRNIVDILEKQKEAHTKELKQLLKAQQAATPVYAHATPYDMYRQDNHQKEHIIEMKKEEATQNHMRRKQYGAFVSEMFSPKKTEVVSPPQYCYAPQPPRKLISLDMKERNKKGIQFMRSVPIKRPKKEASHLPDSHLPSEEELPPEVLIKHKGDENMRRALKWVKPVAPGPPEVRPISPNKARMRILEISKKQVANKGWDDSALESLLESGVVHKTTEDALTALHSNSDALMEALSYKVELLKHIVQKETF